MESIGRKSEAESGELETKVTDVLALTANMGVGYDFMADDSTTEATFLGLDVEIDGIAPDEVVMRGGLGAILRNNENIELTARYDINAREDYENQTVSLTLRVKF